MSCFVVSDYHVSALVAWAISHGVDLDEPEPEPVDQVADRLAAALADLTEPELAAIRSAMVAIAAARRPADLARGAA